MAAAEATSCRPRPLKIEQGDRLVAGAPGFRPAASSASVAWICRGRNGLRLQGMVQIADLDALLEQIDDRLRFGVERGRDLRLVGIVGADRGDEGAGPHQFGREVGRPGTTSR